MIPTRLLPAIDWSLMGRALETYQKYGYTYIEAPWLVCTEATLSTLPPCGAVPCELTVQNPRHGYTERQGDLVGSAEQGLVHLLLDGNLEPGRWVAAGPCFRYEAAVDHLHHPYFFKIELMRLLTVDQQRYAPDHLADVLHDAMDAISTLTKKAPTMVATADGFDLEINGIEVGSYGIRTFRGWKWVYGTGMAFPRINQACL